MPQTSPIILLTRPAEQANQFRKTLGQDLDVVVSPVIKIKVLIKNYNLHKYSAVIFASQNAVNAASGFTGISGMKAFVVGKKTGKLARSIGLIVDSVDSNADNLIKKIISLNRKGKLLFLRGKHSTGNIQQSLNLAGIETDSAIIYEQEPVNLSTAAIAVLKGDRPVLLPLFSPRSAMLLAAQINAAKPTAPLIISAISTATLDAWDGPDPVYCSVADSPTGVAVAEDILRRFR